MFDKKKGASLDTFSYQEDEFQFTVFPSNPPRLYH